MPIDVKAVFPAEDAHAIASCNSTAFYSDQHWRHQYGSMPLTDIVTQTALRTPWTLSTSRHRLRCLKAVDLATGELVGYARWILPNSLVGNDEVWPEAMIPHPSKEQLAKWKADYQSTMDPRSGSAKGLNMAMVGPLGDRPGRQDSVIRAKYSDREFMELDYLAVRNDWQGKGIGKMLVRTGIQKANEQGFHLIIMGFTQKGRSLYQRMPELRYEGEVRQSCEEWSEGREADCECVAAFWVALWQKREK